MARPLGRTGHGRSAQWHVARAVPGNWSRRLADRPFGATTTAGTDGKPALLFVKQTFLGDDCKTKGYAHHVTEVACVILAHNLWVLARLPVRGTHRKKT